MGSGFLLFLGLVVAGGVEGEFAEELACGGVDDADVEVVNQDQDAGSGVGSPDADVVESPVVAQGEGTCFVDPVVTDAVVAVSAGFRGLPWGGWRMRLLGTGLCRTF